MNCHAPDTTGSTTTTAPAVVGANVPCRQCGYNLRGLPAGHRCPECGGPVLQSLLAQARSGAIDPALRSMVAGLGYPAEAVAFLGRAYVDLLEGAGQDPARVDFASLEPRYFAIAVAGQAVRRLGSPERAAEQFHAWGLRCSDDLGRVLAFVAGAGDAAGSRYAGTFTTDDLFGLPGSNRDTRA